MGAARKGCLKTELRHELWWAAINRQH